MINNTKLREVNVNTAYFPILARINMSVNVVNLSKKEHLTSNSLIKRSGKRKKKARVILIGLFHSKWPTIRLAIVSCRFSFWLVNSVNKKVNPQTHNTIAIYLRKRRYKNVTFDVITIRWRHTYSSNFLVILAKVYIKCIPVWLVNCSLVNCLVLKLNRILRKIFLSPGRNRTLNLLISVRRSNNWATRTRMAERRLRCVLVRMCDIRTANTAVSICVYILLTDIYQTTCNLII